MTSKRKAKSTGTRSFSPAVAERGAAAFRTHRDRAQRDRAQRDRAQRDELHAHDAREEDEGPADIDAFRLALVRNIHTFLRMPRRCREPICRRSRRCAGRDMRCVRDFPPPRARSGQPSHIHHIRRTLERIIAERGDD